MKRIMDIPHLFTDINFYMALFTSVLYSISIVLGIYSYERYRGRSPMLSIVDAHPVVRSLAAATFIYALYITGWNNLLAKAARSPVYAPAVVALGFTTGFVGMMSWFGVGLRVLKYRLERSKT